MVRCLSAVFSVLLALGCTCERNAGPSQAAPTELRWSCTALPDAATFTLRASGESAPAADDELALFAVELGRPVAAGQHLVVPYLDHDAGTPRARLALLGADLTTSRSVDLGAVHGGAAPPQVALRGERIFLALADTDASGEDYRAGTLPLNAATGSEPLWLLELPGGSDRSPAFDLAPLNESALLVWDEWDSSEGHGLIRGAVFAEGKAAAARQLSPQGGDVEGPRVVARKDGFFLVWTALGAALPLAAEGAGGNAGASEAVQAAQRWIQIRPLDAAGAPNGDVIDVTPRDGYVVGFDVLAGHGDSVLLAYRDDRSSPGISGGRIQTARVNSAGNVELRTVAEEDIGTGIPSLVFDSDPNNGAPHGWLAYSESDGDTRLVALSPSGEALAMGNDTLRVDEGALLAARTGQLTFARPRGRNAELFRIRCGQFRLPVAATTVPQVNEPVE